jgi:HlyD family secretion protein
MTTPLNATKDINAVLTARRKRRALWLLIAILMAALVGAAVVARSSRQDEAPAYVTEVVTRGDLEVKVSATGTLQPTNTVEVGSELSGLIEAVFVDDNDTVKRGQELARLDTSKLGDQITRSEASLASAEARLAQTAATVKESTASLERLREVSRLSGGRVPSKAEMETAEATLARAGADRDSAAAAVTESRATLNSDRTSLAKASIRSPIDGIVLKRSVEPGQTVAASLQVATLFTIAEDLRQMELEVDVDEADVGRVKERQTATFTVDAYPTRTYDAHVVRVAYGATTQADVVSYTAVLRVRNDDLSLRPGMTASSEIRSASVKDALLVPNGALRFTPPETTGSTARRGLAGGLLPTPPRQEPKQTEATTVTGGRRVWVLRDNVPAPVTVTVGESDGRYTEILGGDLQPGTAVITDAAGAPS